MSQNRNCFSVGIVVPYDMLAQGLRLVIDELKDFEVVTVVSDHCQFFIERIILSHPDILIVDPDILDFKKRGDVENIMEETDCKHIVALSAHYINPDILKRYHAIIDISDNQDRINNKLKKLVQTERVETESNELTSREREILVSIAKGMMNKEIADKHNLSIHTVITHRKNITKKTGIKSVSGLTVYAILNNLIDIQDIE